MCPVSPIGNDGRVHIVVGLVSLVATVLVVSALCKRADLPAPLILIVVGIVGSYLPFVPTVHLEPEMVLLGMLPPLLYSAALNTSLVDFNANRRSILLLSVGLVAVTTICIGFLVHGLLPGVSWSAAFAIGAVVAPPDAVAATAIGRRIGLPRRIVTVLEGESLLNDATALVALQTALAATVAWQTVTLDFVRAAGGGVVIGLVGFVVVAFLRKHITDPLMDSGLSFVTPFAAYVAAEEIKASGVIAVVVAGLLLGHKAPLIQTAQSRIAERMNWRSIAFLLEGAVFLLIGLQAQEILGDVGSNGLGTGRILLICIATLVGVIVVRMVWVLLNRYVLATPGGVRIPVTYAVLTGWAGMRGVVTLAAALVIPVDTPRRDVLLLIAFAVTAGTLFLQGFSLPWLARVLKVPAPDPMADALARANVIHQATQAGLKDLECMAEDDPHEVDAVLRDRVERRVLSAWERVGLNEAETPSEIYARRRQSMIDAERRRVLEIRDSGSVDHEVVEQVLGMLDVEESMLDHSVDERERMRSMAGNIILEGDCDDLRAVRPPVEPHTLGQCDACLAEGLVWVHLRMCVVCGNVACCDSSPARHATAHFHETGHEVMRSAEPGETWRWCFVHELTG